MAFSTVWTEHVSSREVDLGLSNPSGRLVLFGINRSVIDDDTDANLSLLAALPLVYPGFFYAALTFKSLTCKNEGGGLWSATATYTRQDPLFTFDTGGGTQHITQAIAQRGVYGVSGSIVSVQALVVSGSTTVRVVNGTTTSLLATMQVADTNQAIPGGTTISSVTDASHFVLSAAATKTTGDPHSLTCETNTGSANVTVIPYVIPLDVTITSGSVDVDIVPPGDTSGFVVGAVVSGPGIPPATTVASIPDFQSFTLSNAATATGAVVVGVTSSQDTSALTVGQSVRGAGIPTGTTILTISDATHLVLSNNSTGSSPAASGVQLQFSETETLSFPSLTDPAPDFHGNINDNGDGVLGVDIEIPSGHFELTYHVSPAIVTDDYQIMCELMTGSVNSDTFRKRAPGEVKFLGARGSQKGQEDFEITFRFARSVNLTNIVVGPIVVPQKLGWDYMWFRYRRAPDSNANITVNTPQWAIVDQVFPMVPFSALGISP